MSVKPAAANTSASPSFAQQMPTAPASTCIRAITGLLCVFECGRSLTPAPWAMACIAAMFAASRTRSTTTRGVGVS